jgi:hypothetical protein
MFGGLILTALITNTYFDQINHHWLNHTGFAPNDLWYGNIERMFTSALVTSGGVVFWEALFFVIFAVGLAEWLTGWKRTAATFWGVHLLALVLLSLIISLGIHQLRDFGLEAAEVARDVGPSAGYFACLGLVSAQLVETPVELGQWRAVIYHVCDYPIHARRCWRERPSQILGRPGAHTGVSAWLVQQFARTETTIITKR